jgi:hypothetical protein
MAAKNGQLAVLEWVEARGLPWREDKCFRAAALSARPVHAAVRAWIRATRPAGDYAPLD